MPLVFLGGRTCRGGGQQEKRRQRGAAGGEDDSGNGRQLTTCGGGACTVEGEGGVFNAGNGMVASTDPGWLQSAFNILIEIFDWLGLWTNVI